MREVELPNGSIGEFPDSMDDAAIASVLRKQFPAKAAAKTYTDVPGENYSNEGRSRPATSRQTLENAYAGGFAEKMGKQVKDIGVGVLKGSGDLLDKARGSNVEVPGNMDLFKVPRSKVVEAARDALPAPAERDAMYDAAGPAAGVGRVLPEMALTAVPIAGASAKLAQGARIVLPKAIQGMSGLIGDVGANAGYAAATAAPGEAGDAALAGAAGAAGGRFLVRALGGLARPFVSKDAKTLIDSGVRPTPGQLFGDGPLGSTIRGLEDSATSIPLVGNAIKSARARSISEYGNAEINAALKPLGVTVKGSGAEAVEQAQRAVSATYDKVLPQTVIRPQNVSAAVAKVLPDIDSIPLLTTEQGGLLRQYVARKIAPTVQQATQRGAPISGEIANRIDGEIGHYARQYSSSPNPSDHPLGEAFYALQASLRDTVEGATPEATRVLIAARTAYRNLLPVISAADKTAPGQFTPRQLNRAAGQFDQTPSPLNRAGQNVLPSTVPDSGTAGRSLLGLAMASGAVSSYATPAALAAAFYSGPGMRLLVNGLRTKMAPDLYATIVKLAPDKQAALLTKMAHANPQLEAQVAEAAKQVVAQLGRSVAVQGGRDDQPQ